MSAWQTAQAAVPVEESEVQPQLVCVDIPGYSGTGYVTVPTEQLVRSRWLGNDILQQWIMEGAIQTMRAVLAADRYGDESLPEHAVMSLAECEELDFRSSIDSSREIQFMVRIHTRFAGQARGIFKAYQGLSLVAAGRLSIREG